MEKTSSVVSQWRKASSVVSHKKKNLSRCIPQRQENVKLKWFHEKKIFCKMILTYESGSQEDQFDEKNGGKKSRDTIPLTRLSTNLAHKLQIRFYL
jgi:hypothetical protein